MLCVSVAASPALAGESFTGRDAAYVDWGVKNCSAVSTDREHAMVDKANANNGNAFLEQYQNESNKFGRCVKHRGKTGEGVVRIVRQPHRRPPALVAGGP